MKTSAAVPIGAAGENFFEITDFFCEFSSRWNQKSNYSCEKIKRRQKGGNSERRQTVGKIVKKEANAS